MKTTYAKATEEWLDKIAKLNNCSRDDVLRYLKTLSCAKKVIHHLRLS